MQYTMVCPLLTLVWSLLAENAKLQSKIAQLEGALLAACCLKLVALVFVVLCLFLLKFVLPNNSGVTHKFFLFKKMIFF